MFTRLSQQLSMVCAGLVFWSSAPAAVFEITHASSHDPLSLNADAFRGDTSSFLYGALNNHGLSPGPVSKLNRSDAGADISIRGAIELAHALGIQGAASLNTPGSLLWNDLARDVAASTRNSENQGAVLDAGAPESTPGVWAMLLVGTGLVCHQMRRKSKARLIRFASH